MWIFCTCGTRVFKTQVVFWRRRRKSFAGLFFQVSSQRWEQVDGFGFAMGGFDFCMTQFASQFLLLGGLFGSQCWVVGRGSQQWSLWEISILLFYVVCNHGFDTWIVHWTIKGRGSRFSRSNRGWTGVKPWWHHN